MAAAQLLQASSFLPSSTDLASWKYLPTEYDYSLPCFVASSNDLHTETYTYNSSEESIQAHITAMKTFLDDFDAIFYQD
jgi:hypothetical protein